MTIDELLAEAQAHTSASINEHDTDMAIRYALTAQACAQTAQAMILAQMTDPSTRQDGQQIRVIMVDTGN